MADAERTAEQPRPEHEDGSGSCTGDGDSSSCSDSGSGSDSSSENEWERPSVDATAKAADRSGAEDSKDYSYDEDERALAGDQVRVIFEVESASGAVERRQLRAARFVMGITIAHLKTHIEDTHGIPYDDQRLFLGQDLLIDPLSLNDCHFQAAADNVVRVVIP